MYRQTDGRTDRRTDGLTDGRTDGRTGGLTDELIWGGLGNLRFLQVKILRYHTTSFNP